MHIDSKGALIATQSPGLTALQAKISEEEQRLERLIQISNEVGVILGGAEAQSIAALQERKADLVNVIASNPQRAFDFFMLTRGQGAAIAEKMRTGWLPSDICKEPEYAAAEARWRAEMEQATRDLAPVSAALDHLNMLSVEAEAL